MRTHRHVAFFALACIATVSPGRSLEHDFTWLEGHWCLTREGETVEEQWLKPSGGLVLGMGRTVKNGEAKGFEYTRIEYRDGVPQFIAQVNGAPPVAFKLTAIGAGWARFENPAHDFPKRVEYRRTGAGLHAEIAGPGEGGREKRIPFDYLPCRAP
jgi:hypothetical protein